MGKEYDGLMLDRAHMVDVGGVVCYALQKVQRRGDRLNIGTRHGVSPREGMEFLLAGDASAFIIKHDNRLLIASDQVDDGAAPIVPWQDLPDHGGTRRQSAALTGTESRVGRSGAAQRLPSASTSQPKEMRWQVVDGWPQFWSALVPDEEPEEPAASARATLLHRAFELARAARDNQSALSEVASKAVDAGLNQLAVEAIGAMRSSGDRAWYCFARMDGYLRDRNRAYFLPPGIAASWERRALGATDDSDWAAGVLVRLGLRRLMRGDGQRALVLWNGASVPSEVDDLLTEIAEEVAEWGWLEWAMNLAEAVDQPAAKAEALAKISSHF